MNTLINAMKEMVASKKQNLGWQIDEKKRIDERILSETVQINQLEKELSMFEEQNTMKKPNYPNGELVSVNSGTDNKKNM